MRRAALTIDVDRDVNVAERGRIEAVSSGSTEGRFESALRGAEVLSSLFDEMGIRATFFVEGETAEIIARHEDLVDALRKHEIASHGYRHEDLTGETTGVMMGGSEIADTMERSITSLNKIFGRRPIGFRAPYLHMNEEIMRVISSLFAYDSSLVRPMIDGRILPFSVAGIREMPVAVIQLEGRPMHSYLWALHEGRRPVSHYHRLIDLFKEGLLVLATHSWHLVETFGKGRLSREEIERGMEQLAGIVERLENDGVEIAALEDCVGGANE